MIQDDTRQTIKFVAWVIGIIIIAFLPVLQSFIMLDQKAEEMIKKSHS